MNSPVFRIPESNQRNQSVDNSDNKNVRKNGFCGITLPNTVTSLVYLASSSVALLASACIFLPALLLDYPGLSMAASIAISALVGILLTVILAKGLLFLLNACRNYCNSCLPMKKSESYIDPGQNLSAKQKEEQYKEALKNVSDLLCANDTFKASLLKAIAKPTNIGNISEKDLREIPAKAFVYTFLGTDPNETSKNSKELLDLVKKSLEEADENSKKGLINCANDALNEAESSYRLIPQASDKQKCRIIDLKADTISPEDAKGLVEYYKNGTSEAWCGLLNEVKATVPVREEILKAYLEMHSDDPNGVEYDIKRLLDVVEKIIEEADEETKNNLIYRANHVLKEAESFYRLIPQASDNQKFRIIDLSSESFSKEDAKDLMEFYGSQSLDDWYKFLDKAKATPAVREEILNAYLEMHSNEMLNEIEKFLGSDRSLKNLFADTAEARVKSLKNEKEISKLNPLSIFAEAYVHFFLKTKVNETSENSEKLVDVVKKIIEEADEATKKDLIYRANSALKNANSPYLLIPQASDKQKYRIIDLKAETISPEDAEGLVEFHKDLSLKEWYEFLDGNKATVPVRKEILKAYLKKHSHEMLNEIEKFLGSDESFQKLFTNTTKDRLKFCENEEEISELNPVSIFAEVYVSTFLGTDPNETSKNSEKLVDVVKKIIEEADEEGKKSLIKGANDALKEAESSYRLVPQASDNQKFRIIDLKADTISPENAKGLMKFYEYRSLKGWYNFLDKAKATPAVREEILKVYLEMHSDEVANKLLQCLHWDKSFQKLFTNTTKDRLKFCENEEKISKLNPLSIFAEVYVSTFLGTDPDEILEKLSPAEQKLVDVVKKSFEEADEETKTKLIEDANNIVKNARAPCRLILNSENQTIQIKTES